MYKKYIAKIRQEAVVIFPGEMYVSSVGEVISTVLGSCISVCLYDNIHKIGGMNHFMLPKDPHAEKNKVEIHNRITAEDLMDRSLRYGAYSIESLIGEMQKHGAERKYLKAKIFGGGNVLNQLNNSLKIGSKNIAFTLAFLKSEKIPVTERDIGEKIGRRIYFLTESNSVFMKRIEISNVVREEEEFMEKISARKPVGEISLFS